MWREDQYRDKDLEDAQRMQAAGEGCVWALLWALVLVGGLVWWIATHHHVVGG